MRKHLIWLFRVLLVTVLSLVAIAQSEPANVDVRRAADGALQIKKRLKNPDNFVLDSVLLVQAKHGNDVCYHFHSRSAWDIVVGDFGEVNTADLTTEGKLRVWPPFRGKVFRPCSQQEKHQVTDITQQVRATGDFPL